MTAYAGSKAFVPPVGTIFNINTGTPTSPTWTPLPEVLGMTPSGRKFAVEKTTNLQSTAEEKLKTLLDSGKVDIEYNYLGSDDPGEIALEAAFVAPAVVMFEIILPGLPSGKTETMTFTANVVEKNVDKIERDKVIKAKVSLDITGSWIFTTSP